MPARVQESVAALGKPRVTEPGQEPARVGGRLWLDGKLERVRAAPRRPVAVRERRVVLELRRRACARAVVPEPVPGRAALVPRAEAQAWERAGEPERGARQGGRVREAR